MVLSEVNTVPDAALPLAEFRAHLRLGTGFGEETLQDSVLTGFLHAALAAVEGQTGKALIARDFTWVLSAWGNGAAQVLPVAPVSAVTGVVLVNRDGGETVVDSGAYRLVVDEHLPTLTGASGCLPAIPLLGTVRVEFSAGMAPDWGGLPADLGQAVLLLAAHYYENRAEAGHGSGWMPFGVTSLLRRYRPMRLGAGAVL